MISCFQTDIGNVRTMNEDNVDVFSSNESTLVVVADGMGGHQGGKLASTMTVDIISKSWNSLDKVALRPLDVEQWMQTVIEQTNTEIYNHAQENSDCEGMGTTVVFAHCTSSFITIGHIGDSRCYISNESGFTQLTEDHSFINFLVKSGELDANNIEELENHPKKHILIRALGNEPKVKLDVKTIAFNEDDTLLLCTDGLHGLVKGDLIKAVIENGWSLEEKSEKLINLARISGGSDNISLAIVKNTSAKMEERR